MKKSQAFSLVEMSIVMLLVGLIIVGIAQGLKMLDRYKINSARSLTNSSPVASINGLVLWIESTKEESFKTSEAKDGSNITTWYDNNSQASEKNDLSRAENDSAVIYSKRAANGLPAIYFNGTTYLAGNVINSSNFTFFVVSKIANPTSTGYDPVIANGYTDGTGSAGWSYRKYGSSTNYREIVFLGVTDVQSSAAFSSNLEVGSGSYDGSNSALYVNGTSQALSNSSGVTMLKNFNASTSSKFTVGGGTWSAFWTGYVAEVIIFNNVLQDYERQAIEKYLMKKYNING